MKNNIIKSILLAVLMCTAGVGNIYATGNTAYLPTGTGNWLYNGYIYTVGSTVTVNGNWNSSAGLNVADNSTVTIYIPAGRTLTVNGSGRAPGIYLPSSSTLIITGEGTLSVSAGMRQRGASGGGGGGGWFDGEWGKSGNGGWGASGGNGQGAAIGGWGGSGASGKDGPGGGTYWTGGTDYWGTQSYCGNNGGSGGSMGTLIIMGTVNVKAYRRTDISGGWPGNGSAGSQAYKKWNRGYYVGGGGGGGRGGTGWCSPYAIGGGGAGGGGGATGGSGGMAYHEKKSSNWKNATGYTGGQGAGSEYDRSWGYANGGGSQGDNGAIFSNGSNWGGWGGSNGGNGNLYRVTADRNNPSFYDAAGRGATNVTWYNNQVKAQLTFDANGGTGGATAQEAYYGVKMVKVDVPTRDDYSFKGYYDAAEDGTQIFDAYGSPRAVSTFAANTTLYAQWSKRVTKTENTADGTSTVDFTNHGTTTTEQIQEDLDASETPSGVDVVDLTKAENIQSPDNVIAAIRNSEKTTANTMIVVNNGVSVSTENNENVIVKNETTYSCANLAVTDAVDITLPGSFTADAATYSRENSNKWGTICVPFALTSDSHIQYYTSGTVSGSNLILTKAAKVEAGKPAIYCISDLATTSTEDIDLTYLNQSVVTSAGTSGSSTMTIAGQFTQLVIDNDKAAAEGFSGYDIFYYKDNQFYKRADGQKVTIPAQRAYIKIPKAQASQEAKAASKLGLVDRDEATGIDEINADASTGSAQAKAPVFNATGQRMNGLRKGVNIVGGKKVILK